MSKNFLFLSTALVASLLIESGCASGAGRNNSMVKATTSNPDGASVSMTLPDGRLLVFTGYETLEIYERAKTFIKQVGSEQAMEAFKQERDGVLGGKVSAGVDGYMTKADVEWLKGVAEASGVPLAELIKGLFGMP